MFDNDQFKKHLSTQWLGQSICYFEELESTNSYLKSLTHEQVAHGQLCITDHQTKGRGQYERNWESSAGDNLTFTLAFKPPGASRMHVLALACARAAVAQIDESLPCEAHIKWPNDILVGEKKVAGILTESMFAGNELDRLLVGIGLNVNQQQFSEELKNTATSLCNICQQTINREQFLAQLLSRIEYEYVRWHKQNDALVRSINKKIIGYGSWVQVQVNGHPSSERHKLLGINQKGELTTISKEGDLETFSYEQIRLITD